MTIEFNDRDLDKVFEDLKNYTVTNEDGTVTEVINNDIVYKGFRVIERVETTRDATGKVIKKSSRKLGISTTRSADRAFRRAGLNPLSKEAAIAELTLAGARNLLELADTPSSKDSGF